MPVSPTQNTIKKMKADGYLTAVVERWNAHARIRQDLFGFIDVLGVRRGSTLAVQTTTKANLQARVKKIAESENIGFVREAGWCIEVHGWYKEKNRWRVKIVDVS